jgi:hypothetical protein
VRWSTDNLDRVARALTELTARHLLPATRRTLAVLDPGRHRPSRATNRFRRFKQNPRVLHLGSTGAYKPPETAGETYAGVVAQLMAANFPSTVSFPKSGSSALVDRLVDADIAGGSVYDALVGLAAVNTG